MKKYFAVLLALLCASMSIAQTQTDSIAHVTPKTVTVYAELLGWNTNVLGVGKKAKVEVEFGDESYGWKGNDGRNILIDENGKDIKFNSMVDAMNYMGARGWKFETAYVVTVANQNVIHWLMSKEIHEGENSREGIQQRRDKKDSGKDKKEKKHERKKPSPTDDAIYL